MEVLVVRLIITVISALSIFGLMMFIQKLAQEEADRKFDEYMRSRGLNTEVDDGRNN